MFPKTMRGQQWKTLYEGLLKRQWCRAKTARDLDMALRTVRTMIKEMRAAGFLIPDSPHGTIPRRFKYIYDDGLGESPLNHDL